MQEPHIGHPVRLVEDNKVNLIQVNMALINQVGQATRTSNSHIYAVAQSTKLITKTNAAVEGFDCLLGVSELAELLGDLRCELAGWRKYEGSRVIRTGAADTQHQRYSKGKGLARASRGTAANVAPFECRRQRCYLDGERGRNASFE